MAEVSDDILTQMSLKIVTSRGVYSLEMSGDRLIADFMTVLATCFGKTEEDGKCVLAEPFACTQEFRLALRDFVNEYSKAVPHVWLIKKGFDKLEDGENFFLIGKESATSEALKNLMLYLQAQERGMTFDEAKRSFEEEIGADMENYDVVSYSDSTTIPIAKDTTRKRVCRYCGGYEGDGVTTFQQKAHSVSQSLGNKHIVTYNECDKCNRDFGSGIESEFSEYMQPILVLCGINGQNGVPHVKSKKFEIFETRDSEEKRTVHINVFDCTPEDCGEDRLAKGIKVHPSREVVPQKLYKALVKYAVGVMPDDVLPHFKEAIEWIREKDLRDVSLPLVAVRYPDGYLSNPTISLFVRKTSDATLPYVFVELRFAVMRFVYIVPFNDVDTVDFSVRENVDRFIAGVNVLKSRTWKYDDYSSKEPVMMPYNLRFTAKENC